MLLTAHVSLYNLSDDKSWNPLCDGEWICAKIWTENDILKILISLTEEFLPSDTILQSKIKKSTQWILVADDFAEFEDQVGRRYGMYFESQDFAEQFTISIVGALMELNNKSTSKPEISRQCSDVLNLSPLLKESSSNLNGGDKKNEKSGGVTGFFKKAINTRRKSLAEFQEINDAVGSAFSEADKNSEGESRDDVNFNKAVGEQIVALNDKPRKSFVDVDTVDTSPNTDDSSENSSPSRSSSLPPPPPPSIFSRLSETMSPRRASIDNPEGCVISAPTVVKHNVQVRFNEEFCRYEGLPANWSSQIKQFGVPYDSLHKKTVEGYQQNIPVVLVMLKKHLFDNDGHLSVGIFRLAPEKDECQRIKEQINSGTYEGCNDVNILANLIKVFFRELPINVLNLISDESIHKIARLSIPDTIIEMEKVFGATHEIIYWLLDLMAEIVLHEDVNKMSVKNMAIVMSPNLYAVTTENAMVALTMAQRVAEFTTNILSARLKSKYNYDPRS